MKMARLWKWHEDGLSVSSLEKFVDGLKEANKMTAGGKSKRLLNEQRLHPGAISETTTQLMFIAAQNPQATDKVVAATLQMNMYLNKYYPTTESLNDEKMHIPAMLETLQPQIKKYGKSPLLKAQADHLVEQARNELCQDVNNTIGRTKYSSIVDGYQTMLNKCQAMQQRPLTRGAQRIPEI